MTWKFKGYEFTTKLERDFFQNGFEACLKEVQKVKNDRVALENLIYEFL